MAKVLVLPLPAHGHINPTRPLARELAARGEEVIYCLPEQSTPLIASTGAACVSYPVNRQAFRWVALSCEELFVWLPLHIAALSLEVLPHVLDIVRAQQPDYLIYDAWCLWGKLAARILHLPAICFQTTFVLNEQLGPVFGTLLEQAGRVSLPQVADGPLPGGEHLITFQRAVEHLCGSYRVPVIDLKRFYDDAEALTIVPIPRAFQPGGESFDERFQFVGPSPLRGDQGTDFPLERLSKPSTLYISLGTICNDQEAFYKMCFAAFGETGHATTGKWCFFGRNTQTKPHWQVVLSSGESQLSISGAPPQNFLVRPRVPQLAVLERCRVFVTQGGMNSVMEGLSAGVPLVVVPQTTEQRITARRVEELGLGLARQGNAVSVKWLQEAVNRVTSEPQFSTRVQQVQGLIQQSGGARRAAEAIIHFTRTMGQKGWSWAPRLELK